MALLSRTVRAYHSTKTLPLRHTSIHTPVSDGSVVFEHVVIAMLGITR